MMNKFKYRIAAIVTLIVIAVFSALIALVALVGVVYPNTRDLSPDCKKLTFSKSLSTDCVRDISLIKKAETVSEPICYDNDNYVPCIEIADDLLKNKQLLVVSATMSLAAIIGLIIVSTKLVGKKKT